VVTVLPRSAKPTIFAIDGTYTSSGLIYAEMTFNIETTIVGNISLVRVNGLNAEYQTDVNTSNQIFAGLIGGITGEHKIRIPSTTAGREIIIVGTTYSVSVTLIFTTPGQSQTSEVFAYIPEIKYLAT
jgi:transaldolase